MIDGIINVYKESGYTSFDVVAKLRGILKQKKVGHTGTLDPMAEGVLMVCLGKATKLVDMLTEGDKIYRASMKLGIETDTEDITGNVVKEADEDALITIDNKKVESVIKSFIKSYNQIPPMYSAIKKDGKKLYEYARAGIEIEREPRPVSIYNITNIELNNNIWSFDVHCSKGTYIRSLVRDIGREIGCYATLTALIRMDVHGYSIEKSLKLSQIEQHMKDETIADQILPVDALLKEYPAYQVKDAGIKYLKNGNKLSCNLLKPMNAENANSLQASRIRVYLYDEFVALYDYIKKENIYKPYKMFLG